METNDQQPAGPPSGAAACSALLAAVLEPVLHWYQSDEEPERELLGIVRDVVADLQADRDAALRMSAALRRIVADFPALNGMECTEGCGWCIRCIAEAALHPMNRG